jgi:hypothetical protein
MIANGLADCSTEGTTALAVLAALATFDPAFAPAI